VRFVTDCFQARVARLARADGFAVGNRIANQDRVARVFRAASAVVGDTAFFLGCRCLGSIAGLDRCSACRHARILCDLGLLKCIKVGLRGTKHRKASTWPWDGPRLETDCL
jgi:hypothetical protein